MRTSLLALVAILAIGNLHAGTPELYLEHQKRSRTKIIKEGRRIKVSTQDGELISGKFKGHDSENLFLEDDTVLLSEVQYLQIKPRASQAIGLGITGLGTSIMAGGGYVMTMAFSAGGAGYIIFGIGLLIAGTGVVINALGIPLILNSRRFYVDNGGKWKIVK